MKTDEYLESLKKFLSIQGDLIIELCGSYEMNSDLQKAIKAIPYIFNVSAILLGIAVGWNIGGVGGVIVIPPLFLIAGIISGAITGAILIMLFYLIKGLAYVVVIGLVIFFIVKIMSFLWGLGIE